MDQVQKFYDDICIKGIVDIDTFLDDDYYLGKYTNNGKMIYPFVRKQLNNIANNNAQNIYMISEIATGKTWIAKLYLAYQLYLFAVYTVKDFIENNRFNLQQNVIVFSSVTMKNAKQRQKEFEGILKLSPFFTEYAGIWNCCLDMLPTAKILSATKLENILGYRFVGLYSEVAYSGKKKGTYTNSYDIFMRAKSQNQNVYNGFQPKLFVEIPGSVGDYKAVKDMYESGYMDAVDYVVSGDVVDDLSRKEENKT